VSAEFVVRGSSESSPGAIFARQFIISGISGDYLECHTLSGTSSGSGTVYVARPYLLRRTIWSGATRNGVTYTYSANQTRSASTGGTAITEKVTPSYQAGDVIIGVVRVGGGVGVDGVDWVDLNLDGRAWAESDA
jgi:hypothetical protein